jgi:hypothetical protein
MVGDAHPAHARIDVRLHGHGLSARPDSREPRRVIVGKYGQRYAAPHQFRQHRIVSARHQVRARPTPNSGLVGPDDGKPLDVGIWLEQPCDDAIVEAVSMILDDGENRTAAESAKRRHVMREIPGDNLDPGS